MLWLISDVHTHLVCLLHSLKVKGQAILQSDSYELCNLAHRPPFDLSFGRPCFPMTRGPQRDIVELEARNAASDGQPLIMVMLPFNCLSMDRLIV